MALVIVVVAICAFYRRASDPDLFPSTSDTAITLYVLDNGFHTDLIFPRAALETGQGAMAQAVAPLPSADWIYVGWGDAVFFVEEGPAQARWRDGLRALFGRDNASVLRLSAGENPQGRFAPSDLQRLRVSPSGLARMRQRLDRSLAVDAAGRPRLQQVRPSDAAWFYASVERFWIGNLCNHWTLRLLEAGGMAVWPWRPMTSGEVMRTARQAERQTVQAAQARGPA